MKLRSSNVSKPQNVNMLSSFGPLIEPGDVDTFIVSLSEAAMALVRALVEPSLCAL